MIKAQQNTLIHWLFHHYVGFIIKRNFKAFNFNSIQIDSNKSILLLANHIGWWDGFMMYWLNYLLFKKRFHIMVMEDTVRKVFFAKYMGAFSIVKGSREMLSSLQYASQLLQDPQNLVLIFPQGKLYSNFSDQISFEKGLLKVVQPAAGKFQYVLASNFIENFQYKKPTVNIYLKSSIATVQTVEQLQQLYQQHYNSSKLQQTQIVL